MPFVKEAPRNRNGTRDYAGAARQREFFVGAADHAAAYALADAAADVEWEGLSRKRIGDEEVTIGLWRFLVEYGPAANGEGGLRPDQLTFRLGTATRHVTQSLQNLFRLNPNESTPPGGTGLAVDRLGLIDPSADYTTQATDVGQSVVVTGGAGWAVGTYLITSLAAGPGSPWGVQRVPALPGAAGGTWHLSGKGPDCRGAIGTSLDAVQGADIEYPVLEFSLASRVGLMSFARLRELRSVVRRTNDRAWNGFARGELLFLGADPMSPTGTLENNAPLAFWNLAYHFRYEPNQTNVRVGDVTVPFVGGHEYVWARYGAGVPTPPAGTPPALVQKPTAVYVERVYDEIDFDTLGIEL